MVKKIIYFILVIVLFSGCSSQKSESAVEDMAVMESEQAIEYEGFGNDEVKFGGIQTERKVIQQARIGLETLTFDESIKAIKEMTYEYNGYFEAMSIDGKRMNRPDNEQYRNGSFTIRIPKDKFEFFMNHFEKLGNVTYNELTSQDVTSAYTDAEARVKALEVQEKRLLVILENAVKIEDIIALEGRLSDVRYEIEGYTGTIRKWDNLVAYTTISLDVQEIHKYKPVKKESTIGRGIDQFKESTEAVVEIIQGLTVFVFGFIPFLIILIPIGYLISLVIKKKKNTLSVPKIKFRKGKKEPKE